MKKLVLPLALLATAAAPTAALADAPKIVDAPKLTYRTTGGFVTVGATVRLNRPFAGRAEQRRYAVVAAPQLPVGRHLRDELFGGTSLGRLANRKGAWYAAEAIQLQARRTVKAGARWQVALVRGNTLIGTVKTVTLRRA